MAKKIIAIENLTKIISKLKAKRKKIVLCHGVFDLLHIGHIKHFESALINFYYGYHFSKLPNFKINGYMGKLGKHHRLIKRIEKVLFN